MSKSFVLHQIQNAAGNESSWNYLQGFLQDNLHLIQSQLNIYFRKNIYLFSNKSI